MSSSLKIIKFFQACLQFEENYKKLCFAIRIIFLSLRCFALIWILYLRIDGILNNLQVSLYFQVIAGALDIIQILTTVLGTFTLCKSAKLFKQVLLLENSGIASLLWMGALLHLLPWVVALLLTFISGLASKMDRIQFHGFVFRNFFRLVGHAQLILTLLAYRLIRNEFSKINSTLKKLEQTWIQCTNTNALYSKLVNLERLQLLETVALKFQKFCELLEKLNDKFKMFFVMSMINIMVNIIKCWGSIVEIILGMNKNVESAEMAWASALLSFHILSCFNLALITAVVGEQLKDEGSRTITVSLALYLKILLRKNEFHDAMKETINILLFHNYYKNIRMHAEGFFRLDWGLLGTIAQTVSTYSIVITQFVLK